VYYLRDADAIKDVSAGSVALFRYDKRIVGEGIVWKEKDIFPEPVKNTTLTGDEAEYTGQIAFHPSSIRLYAPPVSVASLQGHVDKDISIARTYFNLDWPAYGFVLQEVATKGLFVT
jgi:hypothetical protein